MQDLARSLWDEPRPPSPPRRVWRDWALLAVLLALAGVEAAHLPASRMVDLTVAVALLATLLWRRTHPLLMVAIAFGVCGVIPVVLGRDLEAIVLVYMLLLPYALFRWGSGREIVYGATIVLAKIVLSTVFGYLTLGDLIAGFVILFAASTLGAAIRYRAKARRRELDQVKLLERERLARDLHDTVAHHVSAMAIRAQAGLATSATNPAAATEALTLIESEASQALTEMRAMVRVLRHNQPPELAPSPRIGDLDRLAGRSRTGPAVDVELVGDVDDVPPSVGAAIFRLAQESVTNARRHARHATRVEVRVAVDDTSVRLLVSDDGDTSAGRPASAPGFGLVGMAERAGLLGGTCEAGPGPGRGWTVTAVLPRAGIPA